MAHTPDDAPGARGPLAGIGVLVTRPARQGAAFAARIAALGAAPVLFPAIAILPPADAAPLARAHAELDRYDIAVFVSPNAAEFGAPPPGRWPSRLVAYAPGPGTAEALRALGVPDVAIPATSFDSEGLLALPMLTEVAGRHVVIFRGNEGRELLADTLRARGASVDIVPCYRRRAPTAVDGLETAFCSGGLDAVTVTSSEGLHNVWTRVGEATRRTWRACPTFVPHARIAAYARDLELAVIETAAGDAGLLAGLLDWAGGRSRAG